MMNAIFQQTMRMQRLPSAVFLLLRFVGLEALQVVRWTRPQSLLVQPVLRRQSLLSLAMLDRSATDRCNIGGMRCFSTGGELEEEPQDEGADRWTTPPVKGNLRTKLPRPHVNPLSISFLRPIKLSNTWLQEAFALKQPMVLDIGCCKGSWAMTVAKENPHLNILGLDIRRPIIDIALHRKAYWAVPNVHFLFSNANVDLGILLASCQQAAVDVEMITIQFPDPYFKKRQWKRRVVNPGLVEQMAQYLPQGKRLFIQTDIQDLALDIVQNIHGKYFRPMPGYGQQLDANKSPFTVQTEREVLTIAKGQPVYRMLFERTEEVFVPAPLPCMSDSVDVEECNLQS